MEENSSSVNKKPLGPSFWRNMTTNRKILLGGVVLLIIIFLIKETLIDHKSTLVDRNKNNIFEMSPQEAANAIGPDKWSNCLAGQIAMSALIARGDKIDSEFAEENANLGLFLGKSQPYVRTMISDPSALDIMFKGAASVIRSGDDAADIVYQCIGILKSIYKDKQLMSSGDPIYILEKQRKIAEDGLK